MSKVEIMRKVIEMIEKYENYENEIQIHLGVYEINEKDTENENWELLEMTEVSELFK